MSGASRMRSCVPTQATGQRPSRIDDLQVLCVVCHEAEHGRGEDTPERREETRKQLSRRVAGIAQIPWRDEYLSELYEAL